MTAKERRPAEEQTHESKKAHAESPELEQLRKEVEELRRQADENRDKMLRMAADFDNSKKRLEREKADIVRFANERFAKGLLPIIDNFERAIAHSANEQAAGSLREGITLIRKQMLDFLESQGLKRLETVGNKFDPHFHEALGHVPSDLPEDTVVEEIEAGYTFEGKLLRPAKVRISGGKHEHGG